MNNRQEYFFPCLLRIQTSDHSFDFHKLLVKHVENRAQNRDFFYISKQ
jgi:hypothetical protein